MRDSVCALLIVATIPLLGQPTDSWGRKAVASKIATANDLAPEDDAARAEVALVRDLAVSNLSDDGAGSLRKALLDAQQFCEIEYCRIIFEIEGTPSEGRFVIRPLTALPEIRGLVTIDGTTQTAFGGDTNPAGPEVEINGSLVQGPTPAGLLVGNGCEIRVRGLTVADFPAPGILVRNGRTDFKFGETDLIGCHPADFVPCDHAGVCHPSAMTVIAANHLIRNYRGVVLVDAGFTAVDDNVISNNQRAGLFAERSRYARIRRNQITDNGASGMFLHLDDPQYNFMAGWVEENVVSRNGEWGIARASTGEVWIRKNAIFGNRHTAIDIGLDLDTPNRGSDGDIYGHGIPNKPVLTSAEYDPVSNKTIVRARLDSEGIPGFFVVFTIDAYASTALSTSGQPEAERWLGEGSTWIGHQDFVIELDGDLRGSYITATNTRTHLAFLGLADDRARNTSELSSAVQVR